MYIPRHWRFFGLVVYVTCIGWSAHADDFVVDTPGVVVTNDGNIVDGDDVLTVTGAGSIIVAGNQVHAVETTGDGNSVFNDGVLDASGSGADGIHMLGADSIGVNRNIIQTTGALGVGMWALGNNATLTNAGSISNTGSSGQGINLSSTGGTVVNALGGTIVTTGDGTVGILAANSGTSTYNYGSISTTGVEGWGIWQAGDNAFLENTGEIQTTGFEAHGITTSADFSVLRHSGLIETAGEDAHGIEFRGDGSTAALLDGGVIRTAGNGASGVFVDGIGDIIQFDGGAIRTSGLNAYGIGSAMGSDDLIIRMGTDASISTTGGASYGIVVNGANVFIQADGSIVTSGSNAGGIAAGGAGATIVHTGDMHLFELSADGITLGTGGGISTNGIASNSGTIRIDGDDANGIRLLNSGHMATNGGDIRISGAGSIGILAESVAGTGNTIVNSGSIVFDGPAAVGIEVRSNDSDVLNLGEILTDGIGSGVVISGNNVLVRNVGDIFSFGADAFASSGTDTTLRLDAGSIIVGDILFGDPGTATFDIGLPNAAMTVVGVPATLLSEGRPQLVVGNTVYVFDPDHFSALDQIGFATADQIGFVLDQQREAGALSSERRIWASGSLGALGDTDQTTGMIRASVPLSGDRSASLFFGTEQFELGSSFAGSDIDGTSTFLGATYGGTTDFGFFEAAVSFGITTNESNRFVANNTVASGIETATASFESQFFSLSATLGTETQWNDMTLRPSARLSYTAQHFDGYSEFGSQADMIAGDRRAQRFDVRLAMATDFASQETALGRVNLSVYGGVDAGFSDSDPVNAIVQGTPVSFELGDSGFTEQAFIGGHAELALSDAASILFSGEIETGLGGNASARISATYNLQF